jgi:hypothetical protein
MFELRGANNKLPSSFQQPHYYSNQYRALNSYTDGSDSLLWTSYGVPGLETVGDLEVAGVLEVEGDLVWSNLQNSWG